MAAKGYAYLSDHQVNVLTRSAPNMVEPDMLPKLIDNALGVIVGELPDNIPQTKIATLVSDLAAKMATAAFTDAAVTGKIMTGFVSGAGTVLATESLLQAVNKLDGNVALKLTSSKLVKYTSGAITGGAATETVAFTGLAVADAVLAVTQKTSGANSLPLLGWSNQALNALDLTWSAAAGASCVVEVLVLKA
jgi:hypothetical protein